MLFNASKSKCIRLPGSRSKQKFSSAYLMLEVYSNSIENVSQ
jgi:hypothetical protein